MTELLEYFESQKHRLSAFLTQKVGEAAAHLARANRPTASLGDRLLSFMLRGKMIRGGLVRLGYDLFCGDEREAVTACGAALELMQSALLIHDDFMDRDTIRRGGKTIHVQFGDEARENGLKDPGHVGASLGICLGDIAFFLGFHLLSDLSASDDRLGALVGLFSAELSLVGAAQMLDVSRGAEPSRRRRVSEEEVLDLYRYKTGRYTFFLPLAAGAILAGPAPVSLSPPIASGLEKIGESLGVIFQLKDDELGLFGKARATGKPMGTDIREGKNTLYTVGLLEKLPDKKRGEFLDLWGTPGLTEKDLEFVRALVLEYKIDRRVAAVVDGLAYQCRAHIAALPVRFPKKKELLTALLEYSLSRSS